jgi:hypothetical protein
VNCPHCGKQISDTAKVCGYCGTKLQAPSPPKAQPAAGEPVARIEKVKPAATRPAVEPAPPAVPRATMQSWLVLPIILAFIGWGLAEGISYFTWEALLEAGGVPFGILVNGALYGLATGLVLWWARPAIQWKGAIAILLGWALAGFLYGLVLQAYDYATGIGSVNWLLARSGCAMIPGAATGWALLRRRGPLPASQLIVITLGWGLARGVGGLMIPTLLGMNDLFGWILGEAISGALGVWITLAVMKREHLSVTPG